MLKVLRDKLPDGKFEDISPKRTHTMRRIRSRNNRSTELRLRMALVSFGIRDWTLHPGGIDGNPDFLFAGSNLVVFVDGCFWHGCPKCGHVPKTRADFWRTKFEQRRKKDRAVTRRLRNSGYTVLRFWEHELSADLHGCVKKIKQLLDDCGRRGSRDEKVPGIVD